MNWLQAAMAALSTLGMVAAGVFASRASRRAAEVSAEPNQRAEDRAAFEAIKTELRQDLTATREEVRSVRTLARAAITYVGELTAVMRHHGIEPPPPPARIEEYNRTGV